MDLKNLTAVIPLGGKGSRLKNITNEIPKPFFPIAGESTFYRCCNELKKFGICNYIVTISVKNQSYKTIIKEISENLEINIDIFVEEHPLGECGALWKIKDKLNKSFLFINGDLIFSMDFKRFFNFHETLKSKFTILSHTSSHPHDSDLISAPNGIQVRKLYCKNTSDHLNAQAYLGNAGIAIINKEILEEIKPPSEIKISSLFNHLAKCFIEKKGRLFTYNTTEYIKDMGTESRFKVVENDIISEKISKNNYLFSQKALFIDRDNTIIRCNQKEYILELDQVNIIKENVLKIANIAKEFNLICLVTNQPQVSMGKLTINELDKINSLVIKECIKLGLKIDVISYCPHHPHSGYDGEIVELKGNCFCRKPNPGLFLEQKFIRNIDLSSSLMVGDQLTDQKAAQNSNCNFIYINDL